MSIRDIQSNGLKMGANEQTNKTYKRNTRKKTQTKSRAHFSEALKEIEICFLLLVFFLLLPLLLHRLQMIE